MAGTVILDITTMSNLTNELNIKEELDLFLDGTDFGTPKYNVFVLRKTRLGGDGHRINCGTCWNHETQEGRLGCPDCDGVGYLWDEKLIIGYIYRPQYIRLTDEMQHATGVALSQNKSMTLITPIQFKFSDGENVILPYLTDDGAIMAPIKVQEKYIITAAQVIRLDNGKAEYNIGAMVKV